MIELDDEARARMAVADAVLLVVPGKNGYEVAHSTKIPLEVLAPILRAAADDMEGVHDRAASAWGGGRR